MADKPKLEELLEGITEPQEEIDWGVVQKFHPRIVGDGYRFEPDKILEEAKGNDFVTLAILAQHQDGSMYVAGNANAGETLILMEKAKRQICFGDEE